MYKASYRYRCECCYCLAGWQSDINSSQDLFYLLIISSIFLAPVELWSSEIFWCLPLKSDHICLPSVETKETDHKAHYAGSSLCVCAPVFLTPPPQTPSTSPHVMPVTWFPGTQSSKSESDFIFNHSKSTAPCFSPLYLHFPLNPVHHLPRI